MTSTLDSSNTPGGQAVHRRRLVRRNDLLRRARLSLRSPSGFDVPMSRQELAEAANAYLAGRGVTAFLCERNIGRYERGETRWPSAHYRLALRQVLGAPSDAALGFCGNRRRADEPDDSFPSSLPVPWEGAAPVARSPVRVVLHWTGRKAYALRVAMRINHKDFAAKLGMSLKAVDAWVPEATGRLRFETHLMLDEMLSRATEDDQQRFDLALAELGEVR